MTYFLFGHRFLFHQIFPSSRRTTRRTRSSAILRSPGLREHKSTFQVELSGVSNNLPWKFYCGFISTRSCSCLSDNTNKRCSVNEIRNSYVRVGHRHQYPAVTSVPLLLIISKKRYLCQIPIFSLASNFNRLILVTFDGILVLFLRATKISGRGSLNGTPSPPVHWSKCGEDCWSVSCLSFNLPHSHAIEVMDGSGWTLSAMTTTFLCESGSKFNGAATPLGSSRVFPEPINSVSFLTLV